MSLREIKIDKLGDHFRLNGYKPERTEGSWLLLVADIDNRDRPTGLRLWCPFLGAPSAEEITREAEIQARFRGKFSNSSISNLRLVVFSESEAVRSGVIEPFESVAIAGFMPFDFAAGRRS